jgi:hypothetical protein
MVQRQNTLPFGYSNDVAAIKHFSTYNFADMKIKLNLLWKKLSTMEYNPRYARLAGEIECYKPVLERRVDETSSADASWYKQSKQLIDRAEKFLNEFKIDEAWKAFHTAKRLEVFAMLEDERSDLANELRMETAKLNEWRREAILDLIGHTKEDMAEPPRQRTLYRAIELKDEHYNNQYYKNKLSQTLFRLLFSLLFIATLAIVIYFYFLLNAYGADYATQMNTWEYLVGVLLFGFIGSTTSAILFTRYLSRFSRITEIGSSRVITLSKIFVGAAFSVFVFLILQSSIAESIQLFSFTIQTPVDYFAVTFISGFSERLAQNAIEKIVGKEKDSDAKTLEKHET